jgi:hypothetical protein
MFYSATVGAILEHIAGELATIASDLTAIDGKLSLILLALLNIQNLLADNIIAPYYYTVTGVYELFLFDYVILFPAIFSYFIFFTIFFFVCI